MIDSNVEAIRAMLLERSQVGIAKYGTTTDRDDLSLRDWLQHALEETLDKAVYLQAAISKIEARDEEFDEMIKKGTEAWKDVPNATEWLEDLRGND